MFRSGRRPLVLFGSISQTYSLEDQNVHLQREPCPRRWSHSADITSSISPRLCKGGTHFPGDRMQIAVFLVWKNERTVTHLHHNRSTFLLLPFFPWASALILTQHNRVNHLQTNFCLLLYRHKAAAHSLYVSFQFRPLCYIPSLVPWWVSHLFDFFPLLYY